MIKKALAALTLGFALTTSWAQTPQTAQTINFGIISTEAMQQIRDRWDPLLADMERQTGLQVRPFFATDYAGVIEAMRFNHVQMAVFGNAAAMQAVDRANGEIFVRFVNADGTQGQTSHLIVHRDSPLQSLQDVIRNGSTLSFGNGDPHSTSGFLVPNFHAWAQNNVNPRTHFRSVRSANHEANALAVANRQVDFATSNNVALDRLQRNHPQARQNIRVIWTSPPIPDNPLVWNRNLPEATKTKIRNFFVSYGQTDAREKQVLYRLARLSGFAASSNAQLVPIRQLALFRTRTEIEDNARLSVAERSAQLADIDRQLAALR